MNVPQVFTEVAAMRAAIEQDRREGRRVGLVPTMGALHAGHLSLAEAAQRACDRVAVTIFVNPTQFGPQEDLTRYPRTWEADLEQLRQRQVDYLFAPAAETMYPAGASTMVEPPAVATDLEGRCRPGHFRGVATIVLKLFQILPAHVAYFGEKDFQQCLVVRDMVRDLNVPIELQFLPTVRDPDGLAMSSRNRYLDAAERNQALAIPRGLSLAAAAHAQGERDANRLEQLVREQLVQSGITHIDYVAARRAADLADWQAPDESAVLLVAARVGSTRLIDNRRLEHGARSAET